MTALTAPLTHGDVDTVIQLLETLEKFKLRFIRLEADGNVIEISKDGGIPASSTAWQTPVLSRNVGLFRTIFDDGLPPGRRVETEATVGFVHTLDEVNPVKASIAGLVSNVRVRDGDFVEFGQPLFEIIPDDAAVSVP